MKNLLHVDDMSHAASDKRNQRVTAKNVVISLTSVQPWFLVPMMPACGVLWWPLKCGWMISHASFVHDVGTNSPSFYTQCCLYSYSGLDVWKNVSSIRSRKVSESFFQDKFLELEI